VFECVCVRACVFFFFWGRVQTIELNYRHQQTSAYCDDAFPIVSDDRRYDPFPGLAVSQAPRAPNGSGVLHLGTGVGGLDRTCECAWSQFV
jgi:hypothetical protein